MDETENASKSRVEKQGRCCKDSKLASNSGYFRGELLNHIFYFVGRTVPAIVAEVVKNIHPVAGPVFVQEIETLLCSIGEG